jgi:hypothetical protein
MKRHGCSRKGAPPTVDRIIKNRVYLSWAYRGEQVNKHAHEAIVSMVVARWDNAKHAVALAANSRCRATVATLGTSRAIEVIPFGGKFCSLPERRRLPSSGLR